jgi:hypothetical protein
LAVARRLLRRLIGILIRLARVQRIGGLFCAGTSAGRSQAFELSREPLDLSAEILLSAGEAVAFLWVGLGLRASGFVSNLGELFAKAGEFGFSLLDSFDALGVRRCAVAKSIDHLLQSAGGLDL